MNKQTLVILGIIAAFILFAIAPIVEVTRKDNTGNVISFNRQKVFLESQSLVPIGSTTTADTSEVTILRPGKSFYYQCEGEVPKTMTEIKENCDYLGTDTVSFP